MLLAPPNPKAKLLARQRSQFSSVAGFVPRILCRRQATSGKPIFERPILQFLLGCSLKASSALSATKPSAGPMTGKPCKRLRATVRNPLTTARPAFPPERKRKKERKKEVDIYQDGDVVMYHKLFDLELGDSMDLNGHPVEDGGKGPCQTVLERDDFRRERVPFRLVDHNEPPRGHEKQLDHKTSPPRPPATTPRAKTTSTTPPL